jgi:hypothetical protein
MRKFFQLLHTILNLAQWVPFLGKWRSIILAVSAVIGSLLAIKCDSQSPDPAQKTEPTPIQTPIESPSPTPSPTPTKPPLPELRAPKFVNAGEDFLVELCHAGNKYEVSLYADRWRLGYMGFGESCMRLIVTLNTAGNRSLIAKDGLGETIASTQIDVRAPL